MYTQQQTKVIFAIPVYNHYATLPGFINAALAVHENILVVNDGSTDKSTDALAGLNIHLINHEKNLGKGAAIITAALNAHKLGMTHMVTADPNGRYEPADFHLFARIPATAMFTSGRQFATIAGIIAAEKTVRSDKMRIVPD